MQTRNALLRGHPYHFSDETLHETLENNMDLVNYHYLSGVQYVAR